MTYTMLLGYFATAMVMVAFLPQAWQVIRTKSVDDISLSTYTLLIVGATAWAIYGYLQTDIPIMITNITIFFAQAAIIYCKLKYGKR